MSTVLVDRSDNGIVKITLNRPEAYNSVNRDLALSFIEALKKCHQDEGVRVVCITGSGKAFCAGQDLKEATSPELMIGFERLLKEHYTPIIELIVGLNKPVVCAVNGVAAGAGANIALACDIVVAHEKASFIQAFSAIGLVPDSGGSYFLPRLVGRARAMAYAMLGDKISAERAEKEGMIYRCLEDENFESEVEKLLSRLAGMPTKALHLTKELINNSYSNNVDEQLALEAENQIAAANSEDYNEGVAAFLEKRKPEFKGR